MSEMDLFGLPRILQTIADHEQTGTLWVQKDEKEIYVYLQDGKVKMVASPHKRSTLAEALMRSEQIDKKTLEAIFAKQRETKKSLLSALKEADLPDEKLKDEQFIVKICIAQIGEEIYEMFSWPEIHCEFMEETLPDIFDQELLNLPIGLNPGALVMEAARRQDEWALIREVLPSNKDIAYIVHRKPEENVEGEFDEKPAREKLGLFMDELGNFDELLAKIGMSREEATELFLEMAKNQRIALKKAKELKRVVKVLGLINEVDNLQKTLKVLRISYDEALQLFIELANKEKISLDSSEDMRRVLSLMKLVNGVRDFSEIIEQIRMPAFDAMKICAGLIGNEWLSLRTPQELKQLANLDILRKDTFKCIKLYERVEELGERNRETMNWLSRAYENSELTNKAVEKYRELGALTLDENLYEEAVRAYKKVVEYAPEDLEAYEKLINAYNKSGHREKAAEVSALYARKVSVFDKRKAIMVLDEANKNFPASPSNLELMATLYLEMQDRENAILTYNILANLMKKQKDLERTLEAYKKVLDIDNTNLKAHLELAEGLIVLEKIDEGVAQYKALGELLIDYLKAQDEDSNDEIADILINVCECIIRYEPNNIIAREWLVDTYITRKDEKTALNILRELLGFLQKEDNLEKLVANLRKVVTMDPEDFRCRKILADTLLRQGKRSAAISEYMQLGLATYDKNDMRRAKEAFEAILEIDPFNLTARQKRAEIFRHLNIQVRAVDEYKLVGYLAKSVGMIPKAVQAFSRVVELAPDKELWCFIEVARLCESIQEFSKAIYFHKNYAAKNLSRGNYGEAYYACSRILAIDPDEAETLTMKKQAEDKFAKLQEYIDDGGEE